MVLCQRSTFEEWNLHLLAADSIVMHREGLMAASSALRAIKSRRVIQGNDGIYDAACAIVASSTARFTAIFASDPESRSKFEHNKQQDCKAGHHIVAVERDALQCGRIVSVCNYYAKMGTADRKVD